MFKEDLEKIDHLRTEAVNSLEPHVSGIKKLMAYSAQLVWIGGKFPIDVSKPRCLPILAFIGYKSFYTAMADQQIFFPDWG